VREGDTVARLTVLREAGNEGEVGFRWRTIGSSAEPGEDFAEFDATSELFGPGQDTAVLYIPIVSDALREDTETFYVEIESPRGGASLGPITRAAVVVMDDD
jgi:solute carrier family 8 (sodium/calcium exchanger)